MTDTEQGMRPAAVNDAGHGIVRLLDREPPAGYVEEWTERISAEKKTDETGAQSVLIFRIGVEWLALPTRVIQEVTERQAIRTIPRRRNGILMGLVSVRGDLLICASLGRVLGLEKSATQKNGKAHTTHQRLLVVNQAANRLAFPVSEVYGVERYYPRELKDVPATLVKEAATYTLGLLPWQDKTVGCLDDELLFYTVDKSLL